MEMQDLRSWREWFQFLFPLLIFAVIYLWRQARIYSRGKRLKEIAPFLNGQAILRPFTAPGIRGLYMGCAFRMSFLPPGRNSPGRFDLTFEFPFDFALELRPRARVRGIETILFRGQAIQTGDREFDESLLIRADRQPDSAMLYLGNPAYRKALLALMGQDFQLVRYTPKGVFLSKPGDFLGKEGLSAEQLSRDLGLAGRLLGR